MASHASSLDRQPTRSPYILLTQIAKGGLGSVELVMKRDGQFERVYAMKRPHPHVLEDPQTQALFMEEARLAGLLRHANVVGVLDVGEDERGPFLLMDYVEGLSLSAVVRGMLAREERLPVPIVVQIASQVAEGLRAAHELIGNDGEPTPLVHRDVSPQNILVGFNGIVRVVDFGIAKAISGSETTTNLLKGKAGYMSPEQLRFEGVDTRSDLYSLGVVLFESLSSRRLYRGSNMAEIAKANLTTPIPTIADHRADVPDELAVLLRQLLDKDPEQRIPSAKEVSAQLAHIRHQLFGPSWIDLGEWMNSEFAHQRDELRARRAAAIASMEPEEDTAIKARDVIPIEVVEETAATEAPAPKSHRWLAVVALLAAVAVGAWVWTNQPNDAPQAASQAATEEQATPTDDPEEALEAEAPPEVAAEIPATETPEATGATGPDAPEPLDPPERTTESDSARPTMSMRRRRARRPDPDMNDQSITLMTEMTEMNDAPAPTMMTRGVADEWWDE